MRNIAEIDKEAPELRAKIRSGEITISAARRKLAKDKIDKKVASSEAIKAKELAGRYDVIVADPPWPEVGFGGLPLPYEIMSLERIENQMGQLLRDHAYEDCHLFL